MGDDRLPFGVYEVDSRLMIVSWNRMMTELSGLNAEDVVGTPCGGLTFYEDAQRSTPLDFRSCVSNRGELTKQIFIEHKNGDLVPVFISLRRIDQDGEDVFVIAMTRLQELIQCEYYIDNTPLSVDPQYAYNGMIGTHSSMLNLRRLINLTAETETNVLIEGESGTGKELIASAIHECSVRRTKPFIKVNCSALSENLLESELFGHAKGSFTGAYRDKEGKFEAADAGTIFLDEIGDISSSMQVKLLRVLQEKTITRVGENRERNVDIRIIAATNQPLKQLVEDGRFREDLYYRLKVFPIQSIPLRERKTDILLLVNHFIDRFNKRHGKHVDGVSPEVMELLMLYDWPGNIRELENAVEYAFVLTTAAQIELNHIPAEIRQSVLQQATQFIPEATAKSELKAVLDRFNGSRKETAAHLGISTVALWKRMKKWELI